MNASTAVRKWNALTDARSYAEGSSMDKVVEAGRDAIASLTLRLQHATRLLERVVIKAGCGDWSATVRDEWCSSYKDFLIGCDQLERDHEMQRLADAEKFWRQKAWYALHERARLVHLMMDCAHVISGMPNLERLRPLRERMEVELRAASPEGPATQQGGEAGK